MVETLHHELAIPSGGGAIDKIDSRGEFIAIGSIDIVTAHVTNPLGNCGLIQALVIIVGITPKT